MLDVKMQVKNMSFSAHADARGIMQLIKTARPRNVVLVHGEAPKMAVLKAQIISEMGVPCFDPANGQLLLLESSWDVPVQLDPQCVENARADLERVAEDVLSELVQERGEDVDFDQLTPSQRRMLLKIVHARAQPTIPLASEMHWTPAEAAAGQPIRLDPCGEGAGPEEALLSLVVNNDGDGQHSLALQELGRELQQLLAPYIPVSLKPTAIQIRTITVKADKTGGYALEWRMRDTATATKIVHYIQDRIQSHPAGRAAAAAASSSESSSSPSDDDASESLESD